jgi:hypothetical protein
VVTTSGFRGLNRSIQEDDDPLPSGGWHPASGRHVAANRTLVAAARATGACLNPTSSSRGIMDEVCAAMADESRGRFV